jgi:hypothetical protein
LAKAAKVTPACITQLETGQRKNVERGMAHQGFDLQLTRYDERGWRATFCTTAWHAALFDLPGRRP